jgi:putative oxidoreductase
MMSAGNPAARAGAGCCGSPVSPSDEARFLMRTVNMDLNKQWVARVLMAALFLIAGLRKLFAWKATVAYFAAIGLPASDVVAALVTLLEVGGGLALIVGWRLKPLSIILAVYTVATAFVGHRFWIAEPAQFSGQLNNFLKNLAIAGGFLLLFAQARSSSRKA